MKKVLFATTAAGALAIGGMASAQGIALFGDARLGLGYQVDNDGDFNAGGEEDENEFRAISRVRFGVRMTGESTSGITFGATIRADNAIGGEGFPDEDGWSNQTAGSVFVSGTYGTLTFGDIDEAHQLHVGDLPELGLTGLDFVNELPYLGNRVDGALYRPTVRYDYDFAGFGLSLSTGSELQTIAIGGSYTFDFGGGSLTAGAGYYNGDASGFEVDLGDDEFLGVTDEDTDQIALGLSGEFSGFTGEVNYLMTDLDGDSLDVLGVGLGTTFGAIGVNAFYARVMKAEDVRLLKFAEEDDDSYGIDMTYDLGGGASVKGGVVRTLTQPSTDDNETVADFGISMAF
jgi:outer membrane protein OmpU